jgi:hypothetical protein
MEEKDLLQDDFLRKMIGKSTLESPSPDFVEKVMGRIHPLEEVAPATKPLFSYIGSSLGIAALIALLTGFLLTSDISLFSWMPGKDYFTNTLLPYLDYLFTLVKSMLGSGKGVPIPVMVVAAAGIFFVVDMLFGKRKGVGSRQSAVSN